MNISEMTYVESCHVPCADIPDFEQLTAQRLGGVIISAPHGGCYYPIEIIDKSDSALRRFRTLEDIGTSVIAKKLYDSHRTIITASLSRAVIDLNRPAYALDPLLYDSSVADVPSDDHYAPYIKAGYGVMPRLSGDREPLYPAPLPLGLASSLIAQFHAPYHKALANALGALPKGGLLIDIHSMPSHSAGKKLPDFVFGDNFGQTIPHYYREIIDDYMMSSGYSHGWNHPYAGGYITRHYGARKAVHHSVQIEINRALYSSQNGYISDNAITHICDKLTHVIATLEATIVPAMAAQ